MKAKLAAVVNMKDANLCITEKAVEDMAKGTDPNLLLETIADHMARSTGFREKFPKPEPGQHFYNEFKIFDVDVMCLLVNHNGKLAIAIMSPRDGNMLVEDGQHRNVTKSGKKSDDPR